VRVSYSTNHVAGHWRAHGRYLSREAASLETEKAGFGAETNGVDIASTLQQWQANSDRRLWKLILSPEFGERLDLQRFARDVMSRMESDMHTSLDWVAVAHFNTDHSHVHIALRGVDKNGSEFKLPREYVKEGVRAVAQHFVTAQLGHRTEQDAALAYQRQVPEQRLTPLDRIILRRMESAVSDDTVARITIDPTRVGVGKLSVVREQSIDARVRTLSGMGLAQAAGPCQWDIRRDLASVLRSMQRAADHQKTLARHGALLSDRRLQLSAPKWRDISSLEGRVLSHGENDTGSRFLLLEGTDGRVYHLGYTPEFDEARSRGDLRTNCFITITKTIDERHQRRIEIVNLGDAEALIDDKSHFELLASRLNRRGVVPTEEERWNGWLGRYHDKLRQALSDGFAAPSRSRAQGFER
jgi:hypothetical protein